MNIYLFEYFVLISKKICANKITYYYPYFVVRVLTNDL